MTSSSHDRFGVFEFREEDELVGIMDVKLQSRLNQPKFRDSPSLKYDFLACVARGSNIHAKGSVGVDCVDLDSIDDDVDQHCSVGVAMQTLNIPVEDAASKPFSDNDSAAAAALEPTCQLHADFYVNKSLDSNVDDKSLSPGSCTPENGHVRSSQMESPTHSDTTNSTGSNPVLKRSDSPSLSPGDVHAEANGSRGLSMESADNAVALQADYVVYEGNSYLSPLITFSDRSIKIESPLMMDGHDSLVLQWEIDDVVTIESQCYTSRDLVKIRIHVLSKATERKETIRDASGVEECKVMLLDPDWCLNFQTIMSLNVRFKAIWKTLALSDMVDDGDSSRVDKSELSLRPYFPEFGEHFDEVVYPEGDADAVFIGKRDVDLLQPGIFINDTIIDFYIQYLKKKIPAKELCRFHFFNSFFFRKMADLDKNPDSVLDGKAAFQRVRKWTRKLNLFEKDYIFIPVNFSLHWSLIVVCHPGEVAHFTAEKMNGSSRVPCILHMDSIRGNHTGLKNLLQSYLAEEWRERQKDTPGDVSLKFSNLRFLSLELPQQKNFYDCGLFLLHYVELFVKEAPVNFNPFNIDKFSNFLTADWFIPEDVSLKRAHIRRLIREILTNRSKGITGNSVNDEDHAHDNGIGLISASRGMQSAPLDPLYSGSHQGNDMNAQWRYPLGSSQFASEPDLTLGDLFEPGTSSTPLFDQYQRHDLGSDGQPRGAMSPIEEGGEDNADPLCSVSGGYFRTASWDQGFDLGEHELVDDSSLSSDSDYVEEIVYTPPDSGAEGETMQIPAEDSPPDSDTVKSERDDHIPPVEYDDIEVVVYTPPDSAAEGEMMQTPAEDSPPDSDAIKRERDDHTPPVEDEGLTAIDSDEPQPAKRPKLGPTETGLEHDG